MKTDWEARRDIVAWAKQVYNKGLVAATDGNISCRIDVDRIMITPSGKSLGFLTADDMAYVDTSGNVLGSTNKPSSELPMHLEIYRQRPEINAVIHAHPPLATAFTVTGQSMSVPILPEVVVMLGKIPTARYATPATAESADVIRDLISDNDVILLDHHGAVTCGKSLEDAYFKMEKLEHAAKTLIAARQLGQAIPLDQNEIVKLEKIRIDFGYGIKK